MNLPLSPILHQQLTVVAISSTHEKKKDALAFGAHEFICTKDPITTTTKMDYILNTHVGDLPWDIFVNLLMTNGTLINLGIAAKPSMEIPYMPALFNQRKFYLSLSTHVLSPSNTNQFDINAILFFVRYLTYISFFSLIFFPFRVFP